MGGSLYKMIYFWVVTKLCVDVSLVTKNVGIVKVRVSHSAESCPLEKPHYLLCENLKMGTLGPKTVLPRTVTWRLTLKFLGLFMPNHSVNVGECIVHLF